MATYAGRLCSKFSLSSKVSNFESLNEIKKIVSDTVEAFFKDIPEMRTPPLIRTLSRVPARYRVVYKTTPEMRIPNQDTESCPKGICIHISSITKCYLLQCTLDGCKRCVPNSGKRGLLIALLCLEPKITKTYYEYHSPSG